MSDFIRTLTLALFHRWQPGRLFVIVTCYLDESGTHNDSPLTVMAGVLGTANQWREYQRAVDRIKAKYGFKIFHAKDWKQRAGEFAGWSEDKCRAAFRELGEAGGRMMESACLNLPNEDYDAQYRRSESDPRKLRLDTKYGLCFRYAVQHFTAETIRRLGNHKKFNETTLHFVLESGHKNAGDAERIFHELKKEIDARGLRLLSTITFADKDDCDPLWLADALAHGEFAMRDVDREDRKLETPPRNYRGMGHTTLRFTADSLSNIKTKLNSELAARLANAAAVSRSASGRSA